MSLLRTLKNGFEPVVYLLQMVVITLTSADDDEPILDLREEVGSTLERMISRVLSRNSEVARIRSNGSVVPSVERLHFPFAWRVLSITKSHNANVKFTVKVFQPD